MFSVYIFRTIPKVFFSAQRQMLPVSFFLYIAEKPLALCRHRQENAHFYHKTCMRHADERKFHINKKVRPGPQSGRTNRTKLLYAG